MWAFFKFWKTLKFLDFFIFSFSILKLKKIGDGYKRAIEKVVEQTRADAGSSKLASSRDFNLLSFLHSTETSHDTESTVDTGFCENQNDIESTSEISEDSQIITNWCSTINISNATEACQAKNKSKRKSENTIYLQLRESLNNVNDAV